MWNGKNKKYGAKSFLLLRIFLVCALLGACLPILRLHGLHAEKNANVRAIMSDETPEQQLQDVLAAGNGSIRDNMSAFYQMATAPTHAYTADLAREAVEPSSWRCSAKNNNLRNLTIHNNTDANHHTIFAFVHVYKAAGTTVRKFFHELAYACHKTWVSLAQCTGVRHSSIQSNGLWRPCMIEEIADGRNRNVEQYMYPSKANYALKTTGAYMTARGDLLARKADIIGGHARIGTGDYIFSSSGGGGRLRYIVFLRDPIERYVSGVLYQNKVNKRHETLDQVASKIKEGVFNEREQDRYWDKSLSYLLTPLQRIKNERWNVGEDMRNLWNTYDNTTSTIPSASSFAAKTRCKLAIRNLLEYNAIVGFTERMPESLRILRRVLLTDPEEGLRDKAEAVFEKFGLSERMSDGNATTNATSFKTNKSNNKLSTSAVIAELAKDADHMERFKEYVKYEQRITDFAWRMHKLQYEVVVGKLATR